MKLKTLTAVSNPSHPNLAKLEYSLKHFNHDYLILSDPSIGWNWSGYTMVYNWAKVNLGNYTHLIYTDGFDTFALADQEECSEAIKKICGDNLDRIIFSAEKNFFPWEEHDVYTREGRVDQYPANFFTDQDLGLTPNHRWRYANAGQFAGSLESIIWWYENTPKHYTCQYFANKWVGEKKDKRLVLDFDCHLFQSVAFSGLAHNALDEFNFDTAKEDKRVINKLLGSKPCIAHANGMKGQDFTDNFQFVYNCLNV